jgi:N-terminal domain of molybdenum-binding protein
VRLAWKLWLENDDKVFGPGPAQLLEHVAQSGSLRKAAAELDMSYSKAYWTLRAMEDRLGFALLTRTVGGASGGGSKLTPEALDLLTRYRALEAEAEMTLQELFAKHFG